MATGYKLDADSIRLIDKVVRQVMASEPTTRTRQRQHGAGGGGKPSTFEGVLGITLQDIPAAEIINPPADMPNTPKQYKIFRGMVAQVSVAYGESGMLVTQKDYAVDVDGKSPYREDGQIPGNVNDFSDMEFIDEWFNTCTGIVHKGRLVQGKKINIDGQSFIVVDVEPCE
tara:strand:+ start:58 stop:570 length:513 start_codon:yes stop_codon:yes gene_type:complete